VRPGTDNICTEQFRSVFQDLHCNVPLGRHNVLLHSNCADAAVLGRNQILAPRKHFLWFINTKIQHGFLKYSIVITKWAFKKVASNQS
jgi:hypothetical protein